MEYLNVGIRIKIGLDYLKAGKGINISLVYLHVGKGLKMINIARDPFIAVKESDDSTYESWLMKSCM